jgi:MoaA/NifB/PqqE/SkfB family radical SAM enzyme
VNLAYDVEADWVLLRTCNFRCRYCGIPPAELGAKIVRYATPAEWRDALNATGKSWLLHLTGGEPSVYPDFVELCEQLTRDHYLSINTNLSHPCLDVLAERIDPDRVHFINAALHYEQRESKDPLELFIERVAKFNARGFNMLISSVMTPQVSDAFVELQNRFEARGLCIIPKVMRGWHEGRLYPDSYTMRQRRLVHKHLKRARAKYATTLARMVEPPTINMFADELFLKRVPQYSGKMCASGQKFVQIEADGNVVRCNSGESLGNILMKNLKLFRESRACDTTYCPYFCEKYSNPPFVTPQRSFVRRLVGE